MTSRSILRLDAGFQEYLSMNELDPSEETAELFLDVVESHDRSTLPHES